MFIELQFLRQHRNSDRFSGFGEGQLGMLESVKRSTGKSRGELNIVNRGVVNKSASFFGSILSLLRQPDQ